MKRVSALAFALVAAWAVFATWQWRRTAAGAAPATSPLFASEAVADLERVVFLRQFAEQYLTYDETSYWRNQTALAFLMSPELRARKLAELAGQRERRRTQSFRQQARLNAIRRDREGFEILTGSLEGRESDRAWKLGFRIRLKMAAVPRSLENPWGLEIGEMALSTAPPAPVPRTLTLALEQDKPAVLNFPCLVENVETEADLPVRVKITSLRTSEIQLVRTAPLPGPRRLAALCRDRKFPVAFEAGGDLTDLYADVEAAQGESRLAKKAPAKPREAYQKTLEQELGFVIED